MTILGQQHSTYHHPSYLPGSTLSTAPPPWPMLRNHSGATAALICGILGVIAVPGLSIIAWILGAKALREIDASPQLGWRNREHAAAGRVMGIVATVALVLIVMLCMVLFVSLVLSVR